MHHSFALSRRLLRRNYLFSVRQTLAGLTTMPSILIELHNGQLGPIELQSPPEKTAAKVLDACSRKFRRGVGSLSPKGKPNLLLEDNDVVVGGMTYVFTPSAGSPGPSAPIDSVGGQGQDGQTVVLSSLVDSVKTIAEMVLRIQATSSETFDNIFAPNISEISQRTNLVTKMCTTAYNPEDRPKDQLWCMVLGRYLEENLIKAAHIYKRRWPVAYAANLQLEVDSAANMFSAQKKIETAFDRYGLIIVPESLTELKVHILDPTLGPQMINSNIQHADGSPIRFAELDGKLLQFATEARPAKRAFAWYAGHGLRHAKKVGWAAASNITVPSIAWGSDTCDATIRDRFFSDALAMQSAEIIEAFLL